MVNEMLLARKCLITDVTRMRIITRMLFQMVIQVLLTRKCLLAEFTFMRTVSGMEPIKGNFQLLSVKITKILQLPNMIGQMFFSGERFLTVEAFVGAVPCMLPDVILQMFLPGNYFKILKIKLNTVPKKQSTW